MCVVVLLLARSVVYIQMLQLAYKPTWSWYFLSSLERLRSLHHFLKFRSCVVLTVNERESERERETHSIPISPFQLSYLNCVKICPFVHVHGSSLLWDISGDYLWDVDIGLRPTRNGVYVTLDFWWVWKLACGFWEGGWVNLLPMSFSGEVYLGRGGSSRKKSTASGPD